LKPRILHIHTGHGFGGTQAWLLETVKAVSERFDFGLINLDTEGELGSEFRKMNCYVATVGGISGSLFKYPFFFLRIPRIAKLIKEYTPDIVILHSGVLDLIPALAAKKTGVQYIVYNNHSLDKFRRKFLANLVFRILFRIIDVALVNSVVVIDFFEEYHKIRSEKFHVIHLGVDTERFRIPTKLEICDSRESFGIKDDEVVLSVIGRFVKVKAIDEALELFAKLSNKTKRIKFLIVGDGPEMKDLRLKANQLGISANTVFTGYIHDLTCVYWASDIFISSSRSETFGHAVVEAMASGLPVIARDIPVLREIINHGENGFFIDFKDIKTDALTVSELISNIELRKKIGIAARNRVEKNFSFNKYVSSYTDFITNLLNDKRI
jgi:glycosyltransferase involved in cell wall biosynthesis